MTLLIEAGPELPPSGVVIEAGPELPPSGVAAGAPQSAAGLSRGHRAKPQDHHAVTLTRPRSLLSAARVA